MAQKKRIETDDDLAQDILARGDPAPPDALIFDKEGQLVENLPGGDDLPKGGGASGRSM